MLVKAGGTPPSKGSTAPPSGLGLQQDPPEARTGDRKWLEWEALTWERRRAQVVVWRAYLMSSYGLLHLSICVQICHLVAVQFLLP